MSGSLYKEQADVYSPEAEGLEDTELPVPAFLATIPDLPADARFILGHLTRLEDTRPRYATILGATWHPCLNSLSTQQLADAWTLCDKLGLSKALVRGVQEHMYQRQVQGRVSWEDTDVDVTRLEADLADLFAPILVHKTDTDDEEARTMALPTPKLVDMDPTPETVDAPTARSLGFFGCRDAMKRGWDTLPEKLQFEILLYAAAGGHWSLVKHLAERVVLDQAQETSLVATAAIHGHAGLVAWLLDAFLDDSFEEDALCRWACTRGRAAALDMFRGRVQAPARFFRKAMEARDAAVFWSLLELGTVERMLLSMEEEEVLALARESFGADSKEVAYLTERLR
jgi:hypothetical protein